MEEKRITLHHLSEIPSASLEKLQQRIIFFGHQSVGNNIIAGIEDLNRENTSLNIKIQRIKNFSPLNSPGFYHSDIGKNDYPRTKIDAFVQAMDMGIGKTADIAFFKFCFVDITSSTDVNELFKYYTEKINQIHARYPDLTIVHFTAPLLRRNQPSIKSYIKRLIGKGDGFFDDGHNMARTRFNNLMRERYQGHGPLFDLAMFESTHQDGTRCSWMDGQSNFHSLAPEYTDDGGHLNELGRRYIAEQLLIFLARL